MVDFQSARTGYNELVEADALVDFQKWAQGSVVWADKSMSSTIVFAAISDSFKAIEKAAPDLATQYAPLLARLAAPNVGESTVPYIFREKADIGLLEKPFLVLGSDDKVMARQPGFSAVYSPENGARRSTLLLDEMSWVVSN